MSIASDTFDSSVDIAGLYSSLSRLYSPLGYAESLSIKSELSEPFRCKDFDKIDKEFRLFDIEDMLNIYIKAIMKFKKHKYKMLPKVKSQITMS